MSKGKRKTSVVAMMAVLASLLLPIMAATPASAAVPINVSFDNKGCKPGTYNEVTVLCANGDYKNGNLGKSWNELDLVPFRVTAKAGNQNGTPASQTYSFAVVLDNMDAGHPGYDVISSLTLNTSLSDASCDSTPTDTGQQTVNNFGGIDQSIYRLVTITQLKNTTCVYDYYGRLALGSHLFPGSALHANMANENLGTAGVGAEEISIPVNEILPQELRKTMTAQQQDANVTWDITKKATPAELKFGDICDPASPTSLTTSIEIKWTKNPATGGDVLVTTHIFAKNPAHRVITVHVTDVIKSGNTVLGTLSTPAAGVDVPANTELEVLSQSITITAAQAVNLNDTATATYQDKLTGIPVPGTTTANATATVQAGNVTNDSASIQDIENISGNGLSFSVAAPSIGLFDGYTAGDKTTGPVTWNSGTLNGSGSVTFAKTVYFDQSGDTSGSLDDTATLTTSGNVVSQASASVSIDAESLATLTINKTTDVPVDGNTVFEFTVTGPNGSAIVNVTVPDGTQSGSATLGGLDDGNYNVSETSSGDFTPAPDQPFVIDAGECAESLTFNNAIRRGNIIVDKVTDPTGSTQSFEFDPSYGDNFNLTDGDTPNDSGPLLAGNYSVAEVTPLPAGWDLTNTSCVSSIDDTETAGSIELDAGETVTCTFTNTQQRGKIIVDKVTDPTGSTQSFEFDPSYGDNFNLTDGDTPNDSGPLLAGNYSVAEVTPLPAGWDLTNTSCVSSIDDTETAGSIELDAGETVTCTFTNTQQRGKIIVDKVTDPTGSTQSFEFDPSYGDNFNLTDGDTPNDSGPLLAGNYSVAEVTPLPAGWDLTNTSCVSSIDDTETAGSIELDAGETVTCTFTNTQQRGKIIVDKVTDPTGSTQSFEFDPSYGDNFNLTDGDTPNDSGPLLAGNYSVAEVTPLPAGWDLTNTSCVSSIDDTETAGSIELDAGETVTCTFTNTQQRGKIIVDKVTDPTGSTQSFEFDPSYGDNFNLTDGDTPNDSGPLLAGNYSVAEVTPLPAGWDLTNTSCVSSIDDTETAGSIELDAGETVTCTFTNTQQRGNIIVDKVTDPTGSTQSFEFDPSYGDNFNLTDGDTPNDSGPLLAGDYSVAEVTPLPAGWDLDTATCDHGETPDDIDLGAGETITCTFNNSQDGTIEVVKSLVGGSSTDTFTFELRTGVDISGTPDDEGDLIDSQSVPADGTHVQLDGFLEPGTYTVCEVVQGPGWTIDLAPGDVEYLLVIDQVNDRVCADFVIGAGQKVTVTAGNTPPPGGQPLTIGFWKNHASCKTSNGNQDPVLDETLAAADLLTPPGIKLSNVLTLHAGDCVKARNLLDKTTIDGKKKKASDPLFNMAAQYLAAKLNIIGGAGSCPNADAAITSALNLLTKYAFNGGSSGNGYTGNLTAADKALANSLNTTLDQYNNGLLC